MSTNVEPVGGWPAEIAPGSRKFWSYNVSFAGPSLFVTAEEMRAAWLYGLEPVGTRRWDTIARVLKRLGLIQYDKAARRWVALRVPE